MANDAMINSLVLALVATRVPEMIKKVLAQIQLASTCPSKSRQQLCPS